MTATPRRYHTVIGAASLIVGPTLVSVGDLLRARGRAACVERRTAARTGTRFRARHRPDLGRDHLRPGAPEPDRQRALPRGGRVVRAGAGAGHRVAVTGRRPLGGPLGAHGPPREAVRTAFELRCPSDSSLHVVRSYEEGRAGLGMCVECHVRIRVALEQVAGHRTL